MSRLEELIRELCPNGVEFRSLERCCKILDNKRKPVTKAAREFGKYPYYGANGVQDYVSDYIFDGIFVLVGEDGSVITKSGTPVVTWAEGKIWVNNHAHIIEQIDSVLLRYLFHYIQTIDITALVHGNIPKLTGKDFKALQVPVPPLPVQSEIVKILDKFTELIAQLQKQLSLRRKQYEYYLESIIVSCKNAQEIKLNEICKIYDGTHQTPQYTNTGVKFVSVENIDALYNTEKYISAEDFEKYKAKPQIGDILMTRITAGIIGKCTVIDRDEPLAYYVSLALLRPNHDVLNSRYLKYYIESGYGRKELRRYILTDATPPKINKDAIGKVNILLPPLAEQERAVTILDRFDTLCNDLTSGLPAEIEARQKQYEYYRDKLLSFKELTA